MIIGVAGNDVEYVVRVHVGREPKDLIDGVGDVCRIPVKLRVENAGRLGDDRVGDGVLDVTGARQFEDLKRLPAEVQRRDVFCCLA